MNFPANEPQAKTVSKEHHGRPSGRPFFFALFYLLTEFNIKTGQLS
jgi:hypothetical protein